MAIKYIFTDLGDLSGQADSFIKVNSEEKQFEFFSGTVTNSVMHRCAVNKSADQSISSNTWTALTFNQEKYDVGNMHDNSTNNTRITIKEAGEYKINYHIKYESDDEVIFESKIKKNGSTDIDGTCDTEGGSEDASYGTLQNHSFLITFAVDDYLELYFYQDNGGAKDVLSDNTFFEVYRVY